MSVELKYKHQQKTYEIMKETLKEKKMAAYVYPTGCGKTFPALKYIEENKNKKILYVAPTLAIRDQMNRYMRTYVLEKGQHERQVMPNFRSITYAGLMKRKKRNIAIEADIIIFDEIHRIGAEKWEEGVDKILEENPEAEVIGMSATPERTDGRNMGYEKFGENVIYEMSLTEALSGDKEDEVVLKTPNYVRVLSGLKETIKKYEEDIELIEDEERKARLRIQYAKIKEIVEKSPEVSKIIGESIKKKNGKYIVFCKDSKEMFEQMERAEELFGKANTKINAQYVLSKKTEGGKTKNQNRRTIEEFQKKEGGEELNLLFCVDMLNEGVHLEGIDGCVMLRETNSPIVYKQQIGRVLTADQEAGEAVIIDVVNNWLNQLETYKEIEQAIQRGAEREETKENENMKLTGEEITLLEILKEIGEELRFNNYHTFEDVIKWLKEHDGKLPRVGIRKDGKNIKVLEMTEEEKKEVKLRMYYNRSKEKQILDEYAGREIEEVPEEYREKIAKLRKLKIEGKKV